MRYRMARDIATALPTMSLLGKLSSVSNPDFANASSACHTFAPGIGASSTPPRDSETNPTVLMFSPGWLYGY
jgi:hypothetical protein